MVLTSARARCGSLRLTAEGEFKEWWAVLSTMEPVWITPRCACTDPCTASSQQHLGKALSTAQAAGPEAGKKVRVAEELFTFNYSSSSRRTLRCFTGSVERSNVHVLLTRSAPAAWSPVTEHRGVLRAATEHQPQSQELQHHCSPRVCLWHPPDTAGTQQLLLPWSHLRGRLAASLHLCVYFYPRQPATLPGDSS